VHLESFYIDSEEGDRINEYSGELDVFARAGHTLKKLSLSVTHQDNLDALYRLKKFVKKQKHLDELGLYLGEQGKAAKIYNLLIYIGKSVKTLTMGNLVFDSVFDNFQFPKLETLRFEYVQFLEYENTFDFNILIECLDDILTLPSLKALTFSQYQRYGLYTPDYESNENESGSEDEEEDEEEDENEEEADKEDEAEEAEEEEEEDKDEEEGPYFRSEIPLEFWEKLKAKLDEDKDKPLKIKYHKKDDKEIEKKVEHFKRIFGELPPSQTFEYEITQFKSHPGDIGNGNDFDVSWTGIRYLISLDKVESI
jgi:hypothetical protein